MYDEIEGIVAMGSSQAVNSNQKPIMKQNYSKKSLTLAC